MFDHTAPEPFNLDAVVEHKKMTNAINTAMARMEVECPCKSRLERAERRRRVYEEIRPRYKTYREIDQ